MFRRWCVVQDWRVSVRLKVSDNRPGAAQVRVSRSTFYGTREEKGERERERDRGSKNTWTCTTLSSL